MGRHSQTRRGALRNLFATVKEWALLICGILGFAHEEISSAQPRPYLLLGYLAMMGLSAGLEDLLNLIGINFNRRTEGPPKPPEEL